MPDHPDCLLELPPESLRCMISNIASMVRTVREFRHTPLWSVVGHAFGAGSTTACEICRKAGLHPDQKLIPNAQLLTWPVTPCTN